MRIIVHTKHGVFYGIESDYNESDYLEATSFLKRLNFLEYFTLTTDDGEVYLPKEMINDSVFIIEKQENN